ncbi:MAG TPA: cysteine desulfurase family protein [Bacteroidales bacterium]|nr:cysteine desulfurase family protein [Bacteroidales bacterium]
MQSKIYLDNAATTRLDNRVLESMLPFFSIHYGNASSLHSFGSTAKEILDISKSKIASCIGAYPEEIIFTSGGTEANNFAIKGIAFANRQRGNHIIVSSIEHDCILNTCRWLEEQGFIITYLPVDDTGLVNVQMLRQAINPETILVSVMFANNEIGTIEPVEEIGNICKSHNIYFHSDACQSFGKIPINLNQLNIDLLTINSHKIYGPKGVGALYVKKSTKIIPLLHGGGQESGYRSSTENIPGIVGFARAAEICMSEMNSEMQRINELRDKLSDFLYSNFDNVYVNGHLKNRLPGHLSFNFRNMEGETIRLLFLLDESGIAVSAGSACSSNHNGSASHVLQAIGLNPFEARGAIRITFGRFNTEKDLACLKSALQKSVAQLNSIFSK